MKPLHERFLEAAEFRPHHGEWSIGDIEAHVNEPQFWSDRAILNLLNEHKRCRPLLEAAAECVRALEVIASRGWTGSSPELYKMTVAREALERLEKVVGK